MVSFMFLLYELMMRKKNKYEKNIRKKMKKMRKMKIKNTKQYVNDIK